MSSPSQAELLKHYQRREPRRFRQYDGHHSPNLHDDVLIPDQDGHALTFGETYELMYGTDVRILIPADSKIGLANSVSLLRKIVDWIAQGGNDEDRKSEIEDDLVVAKNGGDWAVLSLSGYWLAEPAPTVLESGLKSRTAAELRREDYLANALDSLDGCPYDVGSYVPPDYFNRRAIIVDILRGEGFDPGNLSSIAARLDQELEFASFAEDGSDIPF